MKQEIKEELLKIGYNPSHIGTKYLEEIIYILCSSEEPVFDFNLERDLYSVLSKNYGINARTIKSDITKATNCVNYKNLTSRSDYCVSILNDIKLTPKIVVCILVDKLKK